MDKMYVYNRVITVTRVLVGCETTLYGTVSQLVFVLLVSKEQVLQECSSIYCNDSSDWIEALINILATEDMNTTLIPVTQISK